MSKNTTTVTRRILNALKNGQDFTSNQLRARFGTTSPAARIADIRKAGYPVYLNTKTTPNGERIRVYKLGTASRELTVIGQVVKSLKATGANYIYVPTLTALVNQRLDSAFRF